MKWSFLNGINSSYVLGLILSFLVAAPVKAVENKWAVSRIPSDLLKNANAVLRLEELEFEIINTHHTIFRNHYVITILDRTGDHWAEFSEYYDKFRNIVSIDAVLYDADGKEIKRLKNRDIKDISALGSDLIDDTRYKYHNFDHGSFPYTIEYEVAVRYNTTFFFPDWFPQGTEKLSVEKSSVTYVFPENYQLRYRSVNYSNQPFVLNEKGKKTMQWSVSNMKAILVEPFQPPLHEITTYVAFAPSEFEIGNYKGNMSSWTELGRFQLNLNMQRDILPDHIKKEVHRLTDSLTDTKRKIQLLYEFLQKNTRYVSIQLGIGGWQPFDASFVANKGYGDCKALSNYMYSMLKEIKINSCYTLVKAGEQQYDLINDFPSRQFNHVILSVPLKTDTVWLECTSQNIGTGYLSSFTANRHALAIDENGGKLVRTPRYGIKENLQIKNIKAVLQEDASLDIKAKTIYKAVQQDLYHELLNGLSKDKLKDFLNDQLDLGTYDINDFSYEELKSSLPSISEDLSITVKNYANITGKRIFIVPNILSRKQSRLLSDPERKYDVVIRNEYHDIDTVEIQIPKGYTGESIPKDIQINSQFGKYSSSYRLVGDQLFYYRNLEHYSGRFPASEYAKLVEFYDNVYKADQGKVVLVKK